jgi:hypothetical protein
MHSKDILLGHITDDTGLDIVSTTASDKYKCCGNFHGYIVELYLIREGVVCKGSRPGVPSKPRREFCDIKGWEL